MILNSTVEDIFVPKEVMKGLNKTFFEEEIKNGGCSIEHITNSQKPYFMCKCNMIEKWNHTMNLTIEGYEYVLGYSQLFEDILGFCYFNVREGDDKNIFYIGSSFFQRYDAEFNYDNKSITFLNNVIIPYFYSRKGLENIQRTGFTVWSYPCDVQNMTSLILMR